MSLRLAAAFLLALALPAFLGRLLGCGGGFNLAKLTGTTTSLVADAKRLRGAEFHSPDG